MIKLKTILIIIPIICYLIVSFIKWNLNVGTWSFDNRLVLIFVIAAIEILIIPIYQIIKLEYDN
jgi:hypothetical protein